MLKYQVPPNCKIWAFFFDSLSSIEYQHLIDVNLFSNSFGSLLGLSFNFASARSISILAMASSGLYSFTITNMMWWAFLVGQLILSLRFCNSTCSIVKQCWKTEQVASLPFDSSLQHCTASFLHPLSGQVPFSILWEALHQIQVERLCRIPSSPCLPQTSASILSNCPPSSHWIGGDSNAQTQDFDFLDATSWLVYSGWHPVKIVCSLACCHWIALLK